MKVKIKEDKRKEDSRIHREENTEGIYLSGDRDPASFQACISKHSDHGYQTVCLTAELYTREPFLPMCPGLSFQLTEMEDFFQQTVDCET